MKKPNVLFSGLLLLLLFSCNSQPSVKAPVAEKVPYEIFKNRIDNYFWMRLSDEQKIASVPDDHAKKVLDYLIAENEYSKAILKKTEEFQTNLFNEIVGRIQKDDESVPYLKNGYYYFSRFSEGNEYPVYFRRKNLPESSEKVLLDVNLLAEGKDYCSVNNLTISRDNRILAYGVDFVSRRRYTLHFIDLESGKLLPDIIENTTGEAIWSADGSTVFYVTKDPETLRAEKIFRHKLGTAKEKDILVYHEPDSTFSVDLAETKSHKYLLINSDQTLATEIRYLDLSKPDEEPRIFEPRSDNHEYRIDHLDGEFYIRTNTDNSSNFKLMRTSEGKTVRKNWTDVIPHREEVLFENFELFDEFLVAAERIKGLTNLRVVNVKDKGEHYLDFGEEAYTAGININPNADTDILRFRYSSLTTPNSIIDYNMKTREKTVLKEEAVLGGFDKNNYESKRLWAKASDGTMVPVSIVYKKGYVQNGKAPMLLYAYGSYGSSTDPSFNSGVLSLIDRGFEFGIAHVRGGSEMGRYWYEDGKLLKKKNTFTDFNDCAQFLINEKYTTNDRLFAKGGSAGGLLIGAIINMKPELYKGVVAGVPFVDVVSTMLDETIPLTTFEWDEWGNPANEEYYNYMLSYSPYDQVKAQDYPNMLVTTGYWDSQVQYWEPAKWVAKLRDMKTDKNTLIMDCNMVVGHGGASGRFERLRRTAMEFAFILDLAGINK